MTDPTDRELRPAGRYEWEQIVRRARLGTVIAGSGRIGKNGRPTKGGMSGTTFTGIALGWASYGNDKGREIWPGDATVAVDLETSIAAVRDVRKALLRLGLLELVRRRTGTRGDEYRLTIPTDLLDAIEVLTPAQHKIAANRLREAARGKQRGGSGGPPSGPGVGGPVDHPGSDTTPPVGGPVDHPDASESAEPGGSGGPPETDSGGSGGPAPGGSGGPAYQTRTAPVTTTDHSDRDLRTAVTVPRAIEAADEPDPAIEDSTAPPAPARPTASHRRPGCPKHPALAAGTRPDGQPKCPLCRRDAPPSAPPDDGHTATVIQFHPRTA